jgi:hypothetical protein
MCKITFGGTPAEKFVSSCGLYDVFLQNRKQPAIKILPIEIQCTFPVPCFIQTLYLFARSNRRTEQFLHDFGLHIRNIVTNLNTSYIQHIHLSFDSNKITLI